MSTNYIAPIWRMPRNANNTPVDKLSNYSIDFDGITKSINCGANDIVNGVFSVSLWMKRDLTSGDSNQSFFTKDNVTSDRTFNCYLNKGGGYFQFFISNTGAFISNKRITTIDTITDEEWHHLVFINAGSAGQMQIYIDGQLAQINSTPKTGLDNLYSSSIPTIIGDNNINTGEFGGSLSQYCVFDYALSTNQIGYLYNLNNPMVPGTVNLTAPVAYWPLGDNSNPNAPGSFPNISVGADSVFDFIPNDYIDVPDSDSLSFGNGVSDSPFSMSAWIKTTVGTAKGIISKWGSDGYEWIFWVVGPNKIRVNLNDNTNAVYQFRQGNTDVNTGEWVHAVVTYDGRGGDGTNTNTANQGIKIYINGIEESSYTDGNNPTGSGYVAMHNTDRIVQLGAYNSVGQFDGEISNAEIWDVVLQPSEILELYNNGQPLMTGTQPQEANLQAWWKLNQSANWEADTANNWQIPDNRSAYPQSFDFDGSSFINFGTSLGNLLGDSYAGDLTFSTWIKLPPSSNNQKGIFCIDNTNQPEFALINFTNQIWLYVSGDGTNPARFSTSIEDNKWHHLVFVYDSDNESNTKLYIDNSPATKTKETAQPTSLNFNGDNTVLGTYFNTAGTFDLTGQLSNSQIWNTALSSSQVETLYNNGVPLTTAIASDNLKAWYKLNNNEKFDGTNWNVENQKYPANFDSALDFNSTQSDFVNIPYNANYDLTGAQTVSFWFNQPTTQPGGAYPITFGSGSQMKFFIQFYDPIGRIITRLTDSTGAIVDTTNLGVDYTGNGWHHLAFTTDGTTTTDKIITYFDGEPLPVKGTLANAGLLSPTVGFNFGKIPNAGHFNGQMSNISYFDKELSASEIQTLYNSGTPEINISHSPIAWWKLNNTTTGIQDSVGSNDGTNNGTTKVNTFVSTEAGISSGMTEQNLVNNNVSVLNGESVGMNTTNLVQSNLTKKQPFSNYSINFDANSLDYIQVANPGNIIGYGESAFTFSGWINPDVIGSQDGIFGRYQDTSNRVTIKTGITSPYNGITLQVQNGASNGYSEWTNIITTGQWYHICAVYDGTQSTQSNRLKLYLNGVTAGNRNNGSGTIPTTTTNMTSTTPLDIANDRRLSGRVFDGKVSNYCVFDRVLTDAEILKIYNNGITQDLQATSSFSNNILAWWPMDANNSYYDGTNWTVRDLQGGKDGDGVNTGNVVGDMTGTAPGSEASGLGVNFAIEDLQGNMYNSDNNAYSINMADYADGVTNPANSGRSTDTP